MFVLILFFCIIMLFSIICSLLEIFIFSRHLIFIFTVIFKIWTKLFYQTVIIRLYNIINLADKDLDQRKRNLFFRSLPDCPRCLALWPTQPIDALNAEWTLEDHKSQCVIGLQSNNVQTMTTTRWLQLTSESELPIVLLSPLGCQTVQFYQCIVSLVLFIYQ